MEKAELIASKVGDLPALPQVAVKVMEMVRDPNTRTKDLEEVLLRDPALTAKILRISNSAFYGVRGTVSTLSRSIVILGFNTLRSIVMASSTEEIYKRSTNFKEKILWEHSLAVALAARAIAKECRYPASEEAFVGGLLHDIGKVAMDSNMSEEYQLVMERVYNDNATFVDAETDVIGFDHTEIGAVIVGRWNLTAELQEAVRLHHQPMSAEVDPTLVAIISLANSLCVKNGLGPERNPELDLGDLESTLMLPIDPARLDDLAGEIVEKLDEEKKLLSVA